MGLYTIFAAVFMLLASSSTAFAIITPDFISSDESFKLLNECNDYTLDVTELHGMFGRAWLGSGGAAQVSSVEISRPRFINSSFPEYQGNVGVVVRVMGHGRDYAKYDGSPVNYISRRPIILSGTLADGWEYLFNCGTPTIGNHRFDIRMKSHNYPYTEKSAWATFTIQPK